MPKLVLDPEEFDEVIERAVLAAIRRFRAEQATETAPLLIDKREAAAALSISVSTLDRLTFPHGDLCAVKLDGRVLFPRAELDRWIAARLATEEVGLPDPPSGKKEEV